MNKSIFNDSNTNRIEVMVETIKTYENAMNVLNDLLKQKEEEEKISFNEMVRSRTTLDYFLNMLKKDTLSFEIKQLKVIIECQNSDLEKEKEYLKNALEDVQKTKKRKIREIDIPSPSTTDMYMN